MGNGDEILEMIHEAVKPLPAPAVFISGGLDSTIILHHLSQKTEEPLHTYTGYWDHPADETSYARLVAEAYETVHHEVPIKEIFQQLEKLLPRLDKPRINLWVSLLYEASVKDGRETVYIGEGLDEHFSGYWYKENKTPQEMWHGLLEYSVPTYKQLAEIYGVRLQIPFLALDLRKTLPYYDSVNHNKTFLRVIYQDKLPPEVIKRRKQPGRTPWLDLWEKEAEPYLHHPRPDSRAEAHRLINQWAYREWLRTHE